MCGLISFMTSKAESIEKQNSMFILFTSSCGRHTGVIFSKLCCYQLKIRKILENLQILAKFDP